MNPFRTIGPAFRRLGVILLITLLVFLCLSLYYFKYIPANRDRLERQGFLMLRQHSDGINYTLTDLRETFCQWRNKFVSERWYKDSGQFSYEKPFQFDVSRKNGLGINDTTNDDCQAEIHFDVDDKNEISYSFAGYKDTLTYNVELDNVFDRTLESGSPDFFQSYMVLCQHQSPHILYSSPGLPVIHKLQDDTLTRALKSIQFSKIVSLDIAGNTHKAFLQPVTIENKSLLLVGLLNENDYNRRLQNIPFSTVSMVIIIFILILILLPYVKNIPDQFAGAYGNKGYCFCRNFNADRNGGIAGYFSSPVNANRGIDTNQR